MARKPPKRTAPSSDQPPRTIGELRKRLEELGNPWRPDPRLSDDQPIPIFPTGGDDTRVRPGRRLRPGRVPDSIKDLPPSTPALQDVWKEQGVLPEESKPRPRGRAPRWPPGNG